MHQIELATQNEELRRAQLELAHSRDVYTDLYEFAPVGYLTLDGDGIIRKSNLTAALILGVERSRLIDVPLAQFVDPGSADTLFLHLQNRSRDGAAQTVELNLVPANGAPPVVVELQTMQDHTSPEDPSAVRAALFDITARKQAETAWRELKNELEQRVAERTAELRVSVSSMRSSQAELQGLITAAMDAIVSIDEQQRIVLFNPAAEKMFGWTSLDLIGQPLHRIIPERLRAGHTSHVAGFLHESEPSRSMKLTRRLSAMRADGSEFPIAASISHFEAGGRRFGTVIIRDITEEQATVERLRQSEQALADFFEEAPLSLIWVGPEGEIIRSNEATLLLLGRTKAEVVGRKVIDFPDSPEVVALVLTELAQGVTVRNQRVRFKRPSGTIRHVLVDANGLWQDGRLVHTRWFIRDVTDRIELERQILNVAERERERFGRDVHDDLGQHLTAIEFMNETALTQWQRADPQALESTRAVSSALRQANIHARDLARGLAIPVLAQANGLSTALRELVASTQKTYRRVCHFRGRGRLTITDRDCRIHLFRIAQEAVSNAVRHSGATRIEINLRTMGQDIILGVTDNGRGIKRAERRRRGMGLRVMQYRAGSIGGSLVVQHPVEGGTAIVCTVRVVPGPTPGAAARRTPGSARSSGAAGFGGPGRSGS